ncbi:hypothetical protein O181_064786 [Austropuccinia psidii MF-1]|uniref:Uncharacterized protein n=1 Tax=Austropuccinia psidii MF-1 TaxID=1389203 RepID=A0A9Q3I0M5_9BASI|nr:hypothetical protein [Austropuccinia psidii MF-1]
MTLTNSTTERSICLDSSALSPKEFNSYKDFILDFNQFTSTRSGQLRFAEAAQFLRQYFPFETTKEDEIRSFFPQKIQLGQMNQGCLLAILRLLSHIYHQNLNSNQFRLYRDLIFLQSEPLPTLIQLNQIEINPHSNSSNSIDSFNQTPSKSNHSNPFRPNSNSSHSFNSPSKFINPNSSINQSNSSKSKSSLNSNQSNPTNSNSSNPFRLPPSSLINSPSLPPRPILSSNNVNSSNNPHQTSDQKPQPLPPPKHYSQSNKKNLHQIPHSSTNDHHFDLELTSSQIHQSNSPLSSSPSTCFLPSKPKMAPRPTPKKANPDLANSDSNLNPSLQTSNINSYPAIPSSSSIKPFPPLPPSLPTKPFKSNLTQQVDQSPINQTIDHDISSNRPPINHSGSKSNLTRSQTFNHSKKPPPPPPRKRPESLQIYNPHSVPIDQLISLPSTINNQSSILSQDHHLLPQSSFPNQVGNKRVISNLSPSRPSSPNRNTGFPPRRSVSLLGEEQQVTLKPTDHPHLRQLKAFEIGLRQDGKDLVNEVKAGWKSRHGKKEERMPLVAKPSQSHEMLVFGNHKVTFGGEKFQQYAVKTCRASRTFEKKDLDTVNDPYNQDVEELGWTRLS